eukprot:3007459-Alexandrium_andersonii.AAC.1
MRYRITTPNLSVGSACPGTSNWHLRSSSYCTAPPSWKLGPGPGRERGVFGAVFQSELGKRVTNEL